MRKEEFEKARDEHFSRLPLTPEKRWWINAGANWAYQYWQELRKSNKMRGQEIAGLDKVILSMVLDGEKKDRAIELMKQYIEGDFSK